jgi:hypothetical protein
VPQSGSPPSVSLCAEEDHPTASQAGDAPEPVLGAHDRIGNLVQNGAFDPVQLTQDRQVAFDPLAGLASRSSASRPCTSPARGKNKAVAQEFAVHFFTLKDVQVALYNADPPMRRHRG